MLHVKKNERRKTKIFLCVALTRFLVMISPYEALRSHSHDTLFSVGLLWTSDHPTPRPLLDITQQSQQKTVYTPGGIGNNNSSKRAAIDPSLRQLGHWVRQNVDMVTVIRQQTIITWRK